MLGRLHDATLSVPGEFPSLTAPRSVDIVVSTGEDFVFLIWPKGVLHNCIVLVGAQNQSQRRIVPLGPPFAVVVVYV